MAATRWRIGAVGAIAVVVLLAAVGCSASDDADATSSTSDDASAAQTAPTDIEDLPRTAWQLVSIDGEPVDTTDVPAPVVTFEDSGSAGAFDGVNYATGTYELDGTSVRFAVEDPTDVEYPDDRAQFELIERLGDVDTLALEAGQLELTDPDGSTLRFDFAPVAGAVGP